nr:Mfa1 family fimbria major subunit [uncultured Bacteroides sp.]
MKIRNLLFAGLATTALFSCSTDENVVTNSAAKEEAYLGLQISFPKSAITKADPIDGSTENGLAIEQEFTKVVVILVDSVTNNITDYLEYANTDFAPDGNSAVDGGTAESKNYLAKSAKLVTKGKARVYVFLNPTADITALKKANYQTSPVNIPTLLTTEMTALTSSTGPDITGEGEIANSNNFLMGNYVTPAVAFEIDGTVTAPTNIRLCVERAAVKLVEYTSDATFTISNKLGASSVSATLVNYNYNNLNKRSFILRNHDANYVKDPNFIQANYLSSVTDAAPWYTSDFFTVGNNDINKTFTAGSKITYCLENTMTRTEQYDNKTTSIVYKAEIKINGSSTATFYTYKNIIYTSYAALQTAYNTDYPDPNQQLDKVFLESEVATSYAGTSANIKAFNAKLYAKGIRCYYNGTCFYNWMIKHIDQPSENLGIMEFGVVRNNVYYLAVKGIANIGEPWVPNGPEDPDPTPVPDEVDQASLIMSIYVLPWTVRVNNINF